MRRTSMRAAIFWFWYFSMIGLLIYGIIGAAGCNEEQWVAADRIVTDANAWAGQGQEVLASPAGQTLPPDWRLYGTLATSLVLGGAAAYKQWRLSQMSKTTKAIVRGIETAEAKSEIPINPTNPVKAAIAVQMRKAHIYDAGNKLVDSFKSS